MPSLLHLVAAKAKLAGVIAGTVLVTTAVGGGGAIVMQTVSDHTAVVDPAPPADETIPDPDVPGDEPVVVDPAPEPEVPGDEPVVVDPVPEPEVPGDEPVVVDPVPEPEVPGDDPVVDDPEVDDPEVDAPEVDDPEVDDPAPAVKQPNPRAVANHSDGKGRDDERASLRGGGSRDPHAGKVAAEGKVTGKK